MTRCASGLVVVLGALVAAVGCAPADVAGNYTVNVTNGENGCAIDGWTVGETSSSIPLVVTQDDSTVQLDVQGATGGVLDLVIGGSLFNGEVSGNGVTASLIGTNSARQGGCNYTITIDLDANVNGDFIEGELAWRPVTNHHADCGILETCQTLQSFNGSRPPSD